MVVSSFYDNSKKFETTGQNLTVQTQQLNVSGVSTFQSNVHLGDNDKLNFGDDDDLEIFMTLVMATVLLQETTGGNLFIKGSNLLIQSASGKNFFKGDFADGAVNFIMTTPRNLKPLVLVFRFQVVLD